MGDWRRQFSAEFALPHRRAAQFRRGSGDCAHRFRLGESSRSPAPRRAERCTCRAGRDHRRGRSARASSAGQAIRGCAAGTRRAASDLWRSCERLGSRAARRDARRRYMSWCDSGTSMARSSPTAPAGLSRLNCARRSKAAAVSSMRAASRSSACWMRAASRTPRAYAFAGAMRRSAICTIGRDCRRVPSRSRFKNKRKRCRQPPRGVEGRKPATLPKAGC